MIYFHATLNQIKLYEYLSFETRAVYSNLCPSKGIVKIQISDVPHALPYRVIKKFSICIESLCLFEHLPMTFANIKE